MDDKQFNDRNLNKTQLELHHCLCKSPIHCLWQNSGCCS